MKPAAPPPPAVYGGQAVIEGVMMRGVSACATAVRAPDGTIRFDVRHLDAAGRKRFGRIPLVRGLFVLVDTLSLGFRSLAFSASVQAGPQEGGTAAPVAASMVFAVIVGLSVFFLLPAAAAAAVERALHLAPTWGVVLEGLLRLALLLAYLWAIGRVPEVRRVYAYHGAEHKTIHAFEAKRPLVVDQVALFPVNTCCGTPFC
jgi:uncharacterized protein YqhQ